MNALIGGVPFDGRSLDEATAKETMLGCIERMSKNQFDGVDVWLSKGLIAREWGFTQQVQEAIDGCEGSEGLYVKGMQCYYGYGVDKDREEAFRFWSEGVKMADAGGFCHTGLALYYRVKLDYDTYLQLIREAARRGNPRAQFSLGYRYWHGKCGLDKDRSETMRQWTLSHQQGYVGASFYLRKFCEDPRLKLAYYLQAAARGHRKSIARLEKMQRDDPYSVIPFGFWSPQRHLHKYVTKSIHMQMVALLIANSRSSCLLSRLPKDIILHICFFVCSRPTVYQPSDEMMAGAAAIRQLWLLRKSAEKRFSLLEANQEAVQQQLQQQGQQLQMILSILRQHADDPAESSAKRRKCDD